MSYRAYRFPLRALLEEAAGGQTDPGHCNSNGEWEQDFDPRCGNEPGGGGEEPEIQKVQPDKITGDPGVMKDLYCLFELGGYGFRPTERSAWIIDHNGKYEVAVWEWTAEPGRETWRGPIPQNATAIAHTHPDKADPKPSPGDQETANRLNRDVYTITRKGIWKATPNGKGPTQVADEKWWTGYDKNACKKQ